MEASQNSSPDELPAHCFLAPEVIEIHLQKGIPIPEGTAKLIWAINLLFAEAPDDSP